MITQRHLGLLNGNTKGTSAPLDENQRFLYETARGELQASIDHIRRGMEGEAAINKVRIEDLVEVLEAARDKLTQRLKTK